MKSYQDLEVYRLAFLQAKEIHMLCLMLPKIERFELGSQVRRSAQSVRANIVEGYGRKQYEKEFVHFLLIAYGSSLETTSHLSMLHELYPEIGFSPFIAKYDNLSARIYSFIRFVKNSWISPQPPSPNR